MSALTDALRDYIELSNKGKLTCIEDLARVHKLPTEELKRYFRQPRIQRMLTETYDLPAPPLRLSSRSLSDKQKRWIQFASNTETSRGIAALAAEFEKLSPGNAPFSYDTHRLWMKQSAFRQAYNEALKEDAGVSESEMFRKATARARTGDVKAVELYFKLTGKPLQQAQPQPELKSKVDVALIIEKAQRHMTPEQLGAFAGELMAGSQEPHYTPEEDNEP